MDTPKSLRELSYADDYDPDSMPVEKARSHIRAFLEPVTAVERLNIRAARGRADPRSRRRLLIALAIGLALPSHAKAQRSTKIPTVGILITHVPASDPITDSFRQRMRELGYEEGRNVSLRYVSAEGDLARLPVLAAELVRRGVDVIVCYNELSTRAAQRATATVPIVMFGFGSDPVSLGLIDDLRRPGGNTTGIYSLTSELEGKRLEILKAALPHVSYVAVLSHSMFSQSAVEELRRAAQSLNIRLEFIKVDDGDDFRSAFQTAKRKKAGAVLLVWSPIVYLYRDRVAALALEAKLPTVGSLSVGNGWLIFYGTDASEGEKRVAYYVDRLLKGAKPSELPVERLSKVQLKVNLKTAKALGISIPDSILARADELVR